MRTIPRQGILDAVHRQDNRRGVRARGIQYIGAWPDGKAKLAEPAGDPAASQVPEAAGLLFHRTRQLRDGSNQTREGFRKH